MQFKRTVFLFLQLFIYLSLFAKVTLPSVIGDNMVLQQEAKVKLWGWTDSQSLSIKAGWSDEIVIIKSEGDGSWEGWLKTPVAGGPYIITISDGDKIILKNILIGEVWLCAGQSNMEMPMKGFRGQPILGSNQDILLSTNDNIRFISVPRNTKTTPQKDFSGSWQSAEPKTVADFSATAYYYARLLNKILDVPIGIVEVSYGGSAVEAWTSRENTKSFNGTEVPAVADSSDIDQRTPLVLFNGMLNPVIGYTIKGALWYQGETNYINASDYTERFSIMVKEWRSLWEQGDFPFYYMQIAPFDYSVFHTKDNYKPEYNSAYLREAQLKALDVIPNSNMAIALDLGSAANIHPADKKTGGERFAYIALSELYGIEGVGYNPPVFKAIEIVDSSVVVAFDNVPNGITTFGKEVTEFEIAGEDKIFYPAHVKVRSKSVVLLSPKVKSPVAVRYAFKDVPEAQIFSTEGIPLTSFRTDTW